MKALFVCVCFSNVERERPIRIARPASEKKLTCHCPSLSFHRRQGQLAKHTIFPCPDPVLGKGVLVQTTLWGNLILGPTARDVHNPEARDMSPSAIQEYILSKCKKLVPSFDPKETFHAFAGARAKSDRGDWIIEPSKKNPRMIHVAVRTIQLILTVGIVR